MITRRIPSYIIPIEPISLDGLVINPAPPVTVNDDWGREHWSASVTANEEELKGRTDKWVYLHALLANSLLPMYGFYAYGHSPSDFQVLEFDNKGNEKILPRQIPFHPDNILNAVYYDYECSGAISYKSAYQSYLGMDDIFMSALKNYYLATDIDLHPRLRSVDTSYWQVVMYISAMESLLPEPQYCEGKCLVCDKGLHHLKSNVDTEWNKLLFSRIKNRKIKSQYRLIFDVARRKIRNDTIHNGLMPQRIISRSPLKDGVTQFSTEKAIADYMTDPHSLESLVEQLKQITRYLLLNQILKQDIFPPLKGIEVHSISMNVTTPTATLKFDF